MGFWFIRLDCLCASIAYIWVLKLNYREANPVISNEVFGKVMLLNLQTIKYTKYHKAHGQWLQNIGTH